MITIKIVTITNVIVIIVIIVIISLQLTTVTPRHALVRIDFNFFSASNDCDCGRTRLSAVHDRTRIVSYSLSCKMNYNNYSKAIALKSYKTKFRNKKTSKGGKSITIISNLPTIH